MVALGPHAMRPIQEYLPRGAPISRKSRLALSVGPWNSAALGFGGYDGRSGSTANRTSAGISGVHLTDCRRFEFCPEFSTRCSG